MSSSSRLAAAVSMYTPNALSPRPQQQHWPNPELSIDLNVPENSIRRGASFRSYYFWAVKGPALDAYTSIKAPLKECLRFRDDLFEDSREAGLPYSIDCYMVGRRPKEARPCIAIICECQRFCRKAIRTISETPWWNDFRNIHPGFTMASLSNRPGPVRLAGLVGHGSVVDGPTVYTTVSWVSNTALPLFCPGEGDASITDKPAYCTFDVACQPWAVMGGTIILGGKRYGLTVAHAWNRVATRLSNQVTSQGMGLEEPTFYFMDDAGDESEPESGGQAMKRLPNTYEPRHLSGPLRHPDAPETNRVRIASAQPASTLMRKVGRIRYSSGGDSADELDWALIDFDDGWLESQDFENFQITLDPGPTVKDDDDYDEEGFYDIMPQTNLIPSPAVLKVSKSILTMGGEGNILAGILTAGHTLIYLSGSGQLSSTQSVVMDNNLTFGDCGRWIFDTDGNWYGHLVAGCPGTRYGYVAPARKIKAHIEAVVGLKLTIDRMIVDNTHSAIVQVPEKDEGVGMTGDEDNISFQGYETGTRNDDQEKTHSPKASWNSRKRLRYPRPFPCVFHQYGCDAGFQNKAEWKRHVASQHLQLGFYRCDMGSCIPTRVYNGFNDFNRRDLFTQHCRRMHAPWTLSNVMEASVSEKEKQEFERHLQETRTRCWIDRHKPPEQSQCGFCGQMFVDQPGHSGWEERMEHVGRHYSRGEASAQDEEVDPFLRRWAAEQGLIWHNTNRDKWSLVGWEPTVTDTDARARKKKHMTSSSDLPGLTSGESSDDDLGWLPHTRPKRVSAKAPAATSRDIVSLTATKPSVQEVDPMALASSAVKRTWGRVPTMPPFHQKRKAGERVEKPIPALPPEP